MVTTPEKMTGTIKKYRQLKNVTATKQIARPHVTSGKERIHRMNSICIQPGPFSIRFILS